MQRVNFEFDVITTAIFLTLTILGWMTVYAVSSVSAGDFDMSSSYAKQLMWIGISAVLAIIVMSLDTQLIEGVSYLFYGVCIVILLLVLVIGREVNGAKSWIVFGGFSFQPSEVAKIATAMALGKYMSELNFNINNIRHLATAAGIVLLPALIVLLQNDTGSALVFCSLIIVFFREGLNPMIPVFLLLTAFVSILTLGVGNLIIVSAIIVALALLSFYFFYRFNKRQARNIAIIHGVALAVFLAVSFSTKFAVQKLQKHQQDRIMVLFDPQIDPQGIGYNVIQSKTAIGSGGIIGKGYLEGNYTKYKFVPKQVTDFIFCAVGEEYGWIGSTAVIALFMAYILRIRYIAENSKTRFSRIFGYGAMSIVFFHTAINIGMTIGLVPVIGIPLPMFSYGGSSVLAFTLMTAILINIYSYRGSVLGAKY